MATAFGKGVSNMAKNNPDEDTERYKSMSSTSAGTNEEKAHSPNDAEGIVTTTGTDSDSRSPTSSAIHGNSKSDEQLNGYK